MGKDGGKPPGDYTVGYKRPPANRQFKPGQSGNPKGRPKGAPTLAELFQIEAARMINMKSGDQIKKMPKGEALVRRIVDMALQGDIAAARLVLPNLTMAADPDGWLSEDGPPPPMDDAERVAMKILMERLGLKDDADG